LVHQPANFKGLASGGLQRITAWNKSISFKTNCTPLASLALWPRITHSVFALQKRVLNSHQPDNTQIFDYIKKTFTHTK